MKLKTNNWCSKFLSVLFSVISVKAVKGDTNIIKFTS